VALNQPRGLVVSGGQDGTVRIWRLSDGQPGMTFEGHADSVQAVAVDGLGTRAASGGFDGSVKVWDIASGRCQLTLPAHTGGVLSVALSGDGRLLVSGGFDRSVKLWEARTGRLVAILPGHVGSVWGVSFNGDASLLASGSFDGTIRLWRVPQQLLLREMHIERPFERTDISGLTGITPANTSALVALGAVDRSLLAQD
jgi:WD40 repeat protein